MEKEAKKFRSDALLVEIGLCETRTQARNAILEGRVFLDDIPLSKPSKMLEVGAKITLSRPQRFVSRAGEKLNAFLEKFGVSVENLETLDIGASTGGFTDCLLQLGAKTGTCVDVGHAQLHAKLRENPRVTNIEKTNARELNPKLLPQKEYPIIVMDLSFISLKKVLPHIWNFLQEKGTLIALIKPQFEATKEIMDACQGVIKEESLQVSILKDMIDFCLKELPSSEVIGYMESPILGGDGNKEFLLGLKKHLQSAP